MPRRRASSRHRHRGLHGRTRAGTSGRARRGRIDDTGGDAEGGEKLYYHLTLLAENDAGYRNLIQLSSRAFLEGYYYKPRVDWELLAEHSEGVIATTGCLGGHVLQALLRGDVDGAAEQGGAACRTSSGATTSSSSSRTTASPSSTAPTRSCSRSPSSIGAPLLATNDSHYTHRERRRRPRRAAVRADRLAR